MGIFLPPSPESDSELYGNISDTDKQSRRPCIHLDRFESPADVALSDMQIVGGCLPFYGN